MTLHDDGTTMPKGRHKLLSTLTEENTEEEDVDERNEFIVSNHGDNKMVDSKS